ncbi:MAG: 30S ribosomal protein S4 [Candidatus Omnitrophica bacterium]|nr:30S ribosomal protein S4 [Candidatus Omnitrophota bacterium]
MGRYLGSSCRLCRREGEKLFLKGGRCMTYRCALERRAYAPGQHGSARTMKMSNFGLQMREKQKVKRIYGLYEKQFKNYFAKAVSTKGVTGTVLLQMLERRLDNVIYQLGFATSRKQGRQIVGHGFVHVNDERVNIPSFQVRENDQIVLQFKKKGKKTIDDNLKASENRPVPEWLEVDRAHCKAKVKRLPAREDIRFPVNEQLIIELYSR